MIIRNHLNKFAIVAAAVCVLSLPSKAAQQTGQQGGQQGQTSYTLPEYNAEQAAANEKDPQAQIKLLDAFVAQYPNSTLIQYVYQMYYQAYYKLKNYQKAIEYADKLIALDDKAELGARLSAIQAHVQLFSLAYQHPDNDQLTKQRDVALQCVKLMPDLKKVPNAKVSDEQINAGVAYCDSAAGSASLQLKDYPGAIQTFKSALATNPKDAVSYYRLGIAYVSSNPPQFLDGFWALARAVDLNVPDSPKIKDYLRQRILQYEQPGCDNQVDAQMNELLQLAMNSPDRPATYTIPSHDDLTKISGSSTIISVINDLSAGGDKAKMTWLAICGAEFPEVVGKIVDVQKTPNTADFMVFTSDNGDQMQNATTANMDVKVWLTPPPSGTQTGPNNTPDTPQPDAARLEKDDPIKFAGTLVSFDPSPFLLHWDQVKVDTSNIPTEKGGHKPVPRKTTPKQE